MNIQDDTTSRALAVESVMGPPGQEKLKEARVLVVGAGGLGSPLAQYLAAAGVGTIGIVDDDTVSISNLQRQVAHFLEDVGRKKVASTAEKVLAMNPRVSVEPHPFRLSSQNVFPLVREYDVIADASDNFNTRYNISDACFYEKKPLITAMLGMLEGRLTTIRAHETAADGSPNPTYRCLFPQPMTAAAMTAGNGRQLGALAGSLGCLAALEVIRAIVGFGQDLVGRMLVVDALTMTMSTRAYAWSPDNPLNGVNTRSAE
ncbi:MAG: HesA/MoeB/ThiF family protein [Methylobacteriaceae bacterium]|jgi:adenylyltransferase/sulfurtransferase|nr:HesA/MoeB/ThiF family protein [Methylobacteriaceae bacterium]